MSEILDYVEFMFVTIGPTIVIICMLANLLNTYVFNTKEFQKTITFRLLFINSMISTILLKMGIFIPLTQCETVCNISRKNLIVLIYEYYICLCMGSFLIYVHGGISLLLSIYRLVSIVIVKPKLSFNINLHISIVVIICMIMSIPWVIYKEIVLDTENFDGTFNYTIRESQFCSYKFFYVLLLVAPVSFTIILIVKVIFDAYTLVYLRSSVAKQKRIGKISIQEANDLIKQNRNLKKIENALKNLNNQSDVEEDKDLFNPKEINLCQMVLLLSLRALIENIVCMVAPCYFFYIFSVNMSNYKLISFVCHFFTVLSSLTNTFIYYSYNESFRDKLKKFLFCIICVFKCKCRSLIRQN